MSLTTDVLIERGLAKEANKAIIEEALTILKDLHKQGCNIDVWMDVDEAGRIIKEAFQSLSEL